MDLIENLTLNCPNDGEQAWEGDVFCKGCNEIYLCSGTEDDGFTDKGEPKKKYVYPDAPPNGMCHCRKRLFGGTDFTARPMCHACALRVTARKAAERGEILWEQDFHEDEDKGDLASPIDGFRLEVWKMDERWEWAVHYPEGDCGGSCGTREDARAFARKIFLAIVKP